MYTVIDLFTGAGGLTYGFKYQIKHNQFYNREQFQFLFANEINLNAVKTFQYNFPDIKMLPCSISNINERYLKENNIEVSDVDVVIGGPPCQAFSTIGKRNKNDERHSFFKEYARILEQFKPKIFLFENVLGILSFKNSGNKKVFDLIQEEFLKLGYRLEYKVLNAQNYGIPQMRKRVFISKLYEHNPNISDLNKIKPEEIPDNLIKNEGVLFGYVKNTRDFSHGMN